MQKIDHQCRNTWHYIEEIGTQINRSGHEQLNLRGGCLHLALFCKTIDFSGYNHKKIMDLFYPSGF